MEARFEELQLTETAPFERDLRVMKVCVSASPLVGLLGTVTGMLSTFAALSSGSGGDETLEMVAGGISEALVTTMTGLVDRAAGPLLSIPSFARCAALQGLPFPRGVGLHADPPSPPDRGILEPGSRYRSSCTPQGAGGSPEKRRRARALGAGQLADTPRGQRRHSKNGTTQSQQRRRQRRQRDRYLAVDRLRSSSCSSSSS
jgi:hypothetical protein